MDPSLYFCMTLMSRSMAAQGSMAGMVNLMLTEMLLADDSLWLTVLKIS